MDVSVCAESRREIAMYTLKEINDKLRNGNFTERNVAMSILTDYVDAEEQGLLIKQSFPRHSFVYYIDDEQNIKQGKYLTALKCDHSMAYALYHGKDPYTYFLVDEVYATSEAAESALKGGGVE